MVHSFQGSRSNFRLGMSMLVFLSCMAVVSGVGTFVEATGDSSTWQRSMRSLAFVGMWVPFICLAVWTILDYRRSRLLVGSKSMVIRGVIRIKRVCFRDILSAEWQTSRLRLQTARGRMALPISDFVSNHQHEHCIRLLHERIGGDVQVGWEKINWTAIRAAADPQRHKRMFLRFAWISIIGPIAGAIAGTVSISCTAITPNLA